MLVLSRKDGEAIRVGDEIVITVISTSAGHVRLGIEAPSRVTIHRDEIYDQIAAANRSALQMPALNEPVDSEEKP